MTGDRSYFKFLPINFFELVGEFLLENELSKFQFCVEVIPTNYYSSFSKSAASLLDIKENILL